MNNINNKNQRFPGEQQSCLQNSYQTDYDKNRNYKSKYYKYKKKYLDIKKNVLNKKAGAYNTSEIIMGLGVCVGVLCLINRRNRINSKDNYITQSINIIRNRPKNFLKDAEINREDVDSGEKLYSNKIYQVFNDKEFELIYKSVFDTFERLQPGSNDYHVIKRVIPKNSKVIFLGDYHSSIHAFIDTILDLKSKGYFDDYWVLKKDCYLVITGDMVDRGPYGIEIMYLIYLLFLNNNKEEYRFFILNGNHEEPSVYSRFGLSLEIENQFKIEENKKSFEQLLTKLPVALFLKSNNDDSKWYQFCHGGIDFYQFGDSDKITDFLKSDLSSINLEIDKGWGFENGFLWSDFTNSNNDNILFGNRPIFPPKMVEKILDTNNIKSIISGHQDLENFGFVYRPSLKDSSNICQSNPSLDYSKFYPKEKDDSLCTLKKIKDSKSGDGSSEHIISMDMAMVIVTSSSTISKLIPKACYGILHMKTDTSVINLLDTCNTSYLNNAAAEPSTCK